MFARVERWSYLVSIWLVIANAERVRPFIVVPPLMENLPDSNQDDPQLMILRKWLKREHLE